MNNYREMLISFEKKFFMKKLLIVFIGNATTLLTSVFINLSLIHKGIKSFKHYPHSYIIHNIFIYKN